MVGFNVGSVAFNSDGWGPPESSPSSPPLSLPNHPSHVPFAPFSRSDKLGRIADWTRSNYNHPNNRNPNNHRNNNPSDSAFDFTGDDSFGLNNPDDDSSFRLVDGKPPPRPRFGPKWRFNPHYHHRNQNQLPSAAARKSRLKSTRPKKNAPAVTATTTKTTAPAAPTTTSAARPPC